MQRLVQAFIIELESIGFRLIETVAVKSVIECYLLKTRCWYCLGGKDHLDILLTTRLRTVLQPSLITPTCRTPSSFYNRVATRVPPHFTTGHPAVNLSNVLGSFRIRYCFRRRRWRYLWKKLHFNISNKRRLHRVSHGWPMLMESCLAA